ncbi:MAG: respiratory nitrate reductase subunit gamma [candidate division Zixibacteria bacterium]|nr:respiratory nitrate reductase subunit gamma [candidate division Zixibacteria bacterium]
MNYFILGILPFITVLIFVLGMGYRLYTWFHTPQPGALTLFPAPKAGSETFFNVLKESFLFPSLFQGDKVLWGISWIFHVMLALIFVGHIRVVTDFPKLWAALGINADKMSAVSGGAAGILIMVLAIVLIVRRLAVPRVRQISNLPDYITLLLITAILVTGNAMRFGEHFDLEITRTYFSALFTFSLSAAIIPQVGMFTLHFLLAQLLIIFIPFSKIMHFGGMFFTQTVIKKA